MKLQTIFPELVNDLTRGLLEEGEPDLAEQISLLEIIDRCRCGCDECAEFYTAEIPSGTSPDDLDGISPSSEFGVYSVHLLDKKIIGIEILYNERPKARSGLVRRHYLYLGRSLLGLSCCCARLVHTASYRMASF